MANYKSIQNGGLKLTLAHIKKAEQAVSSGKWTDTSILLERVKT